MKSHKISLILFLLLCIVISSVAFSETQTVITPKSDVIYVHEGKTVDIRLTLSPRAARAKGVTYDSDNEAIATVSSRGRVKGIAEGQCNIIVTSKYDATSIKVPVTVVVPAKSMTLSAQSTTLRAGEEPLQLTATFTPENTSVKKANYKSSDKRIATVDENGLVTGVKGGKVSIVATSTDGGRARAKINLVVQQPVTGVRYRTPHIRVGASSYTNIGADIEPKTATNKKMTWETEDPSIASVTGTTNRVRVRGIRWGQTTITGTTEDGDYKVSIVVDVGSLRHAVRIKSLKMKNGAPRITLVNNSNLNITEVRYSIKGYDAEGNQIPMGRNQDILNGLYSHTLYPGDMTNHGEFYFIKPAKYQQELDHYELAITGWSTETGYYNTRGEILYNFNISQADYEWLTNN